MPRALGGSFKSMQGSPGVSSAYRNWETAESRLHSKFDLLVSACLHFKSVSFEMHGVVSPNREPDHCFEVGIHFEVVELLELHHANGAIRF